MHLQAINYLTVGHMIADLVTVIGTLDIVFGEVDWSRILALVFFIYSFFSF
jgi:type IV secretory pathway VirB2 component (pilin)